MRWARCDGVLLGDGRYMPCMRRASRRTALCKVHRALVGRQEARPSVTAEMRLTNTFPRVQQ